MNSFDSFYERTVGKALNYFIKSRGIDKAYKKIMNHFEKPKP